MAGTATVMLLDCRVLSVDVARFEVRLTTASAALADRECQWENLYCATNADGSNDEFYEVIDRFAIAEKRRKEAARAAKKVRFKLWSTPLQSTPQAKRHCLQLCASYHLLSSVVNHRTLP
jgi:hypothetical protein